MHKKIKSKFFIIICIIFTFIFSIFANILADENKVEINNNKTEESEIYNNNPADVQAKKETIKKLIEKLTLEKKLIEPNKLIVGTNATFKPFEYIDEEGKIIGFDIELIKEIAKMFNLEVVIVDMPFESLISSIAAKKVDVVIAGLTETEERKKSVNFSNSYFKGKQFILTPNDKDKKIVNEDSLKNLTCGTQGATTASDVAKKINGLKVKEYDAYDVMVEDLLLKRIDVVILDQIAAMAYKKKHQDKINLIDGTILNFPIENSCIACAKDNNDLLEAINQALDIIKPSPFYADIVKKYMDIDINVKDEKNIANKDSNSLKNQFITAFIEKDRWKQYIKGLKMTLIITVFAAILGFFLGAILAVLKMTKNKKGKRTIIAKIASLYISVVRGTPILVQLLILWLVVLKNLKSGTLVAIIAFGLNSAAYVAEIIRGGINAVDIGQTEAGHAMGFSKIQTMIYIVLPQGLKNAIPALCNEIVSLIKETAIVGYIALTDLTKVAFSISASSYQTFMPLMGAAILYYLTTKIASLILEFVERRLR